jgi:tRNA-specific 2-thiouridylase
MLDIRSEFKSSVVDYFARTYRSGLTPNPCMICNSIIKFGHVLSASRKLGATHIATGHYARIVRDEAGRFHLMRGRDPNKEQSYFLAMLSQEQMARILFPLAMATKSEVRNVAREEGLADLVKTESQDVCFIKEGGYGQFLNRQGMIRSRPGDIVDMSGRKIGEHSGLHLFTVGQRRGIDCPSAEPYYVVHIDATTNRLVVGRKKDLLTTECRVDGTHWIVSAPTSPISVHTRVRYRHTASPSTVYPTDTRSAVIRFKRPEAVVTPGQCAVFYHEEEVLGGGWIRT